MDLLLRRVGNISNEPGDGVAPLAGLNYQRLVAVAIRLVRRQYAVFAVQQFRNSDVALVEGMLNLFDFGLSLWQGFLELFLDFLDSMLELLGELLQRLQLIIRSQAMNRNLRPS